MGITTSDVNGPINHGGGRLESDLIVDGRIVAALERPFFQA